MSGTKRVPRTIPAKPGQLKAQWGKEDRHAEASVVYLWGGSGAAKADARVLMSALERKPLRVGFDGRVTEGASLVEELEARGYDLSTLRFTIQMKEGRA